MSCNSCNNPCKNNACLPASYDSCLFEIASNPYNPNEWIVTSNGMTHKVKVPGYNETDTTLSTNYSNSTLNYKAEKHTDTITGEQLGGLINLKDLRDVNFDNGVNGTCYELIYRKFADCGEGCESPADKWSNFNINSNGAKKDWLTYVRGANAYGCPEYLTPPTDKSKYWYAGWKQDGEHKSFGYFQSEKVDKLPTNANGDYIVSSVDPATGKPVHGAIPLSCWITNLAMSMGAEAKITWTILKQTPSFSYKANAFTGDWSVTWNDWYGNVETGHPTYHCGSGTVSGRMNYDKHFNANNGSFTFTLHSIWVDKVVYTVDQGTGMSTVGNPYLNLSTIDPATGTRKAVITRQESGYKSWSKTINETITYERSFTVGPGQTMGPIDFLYLFNDWYQDLDDECILHFNIENKLLGWNNC